VKKKILGVTFPSVEARKQQIPFTAIFNREILLKRVREFAAEDDSKLRLLCQHHGIPEGPLMYRQLALVLARELYPESKRGRPSKWTWLAQGMLVVEIERLVKPGDPAFGVTWACKQLAKREPWKSFLETRESEATGPDPAEAMRQVYARFRNHKWADVTREAYNSHVHQSTVGEWDRDIEYYVKNSHLK
jgi:hypothetical protein